MDILDRLLGHDAWTTRLLLERCREFSDEQLDRRFDIGDRSLRETFVHIMENMEFWGDRIAEREVREYADDSSVEGLLQRHSHAAKELANCCRRVQQQGRLDVLYVAPEDPIPRPLGAMIVHIITHSMHHRAQALHIMEQLGLHDLPAGDPLDWEHRAFGWR
ncbi:MAG: DinB family protein [Chloroflexi bacterium]|nr:DinB family protein [Chloroflexota bacterium]